MIARIRILLFLGFLFALPAQAGHLFTQNVLNTPINLTAGNGINITQDTFEGAGSNGQVSLDFINDASGGWSAGDALKITIGGYTQTFSYDAPLAGANQSAISLNVTDPALTAAALDLDETSPFDWSIQATAGDFTFAGYRIRTTSETLDGTGAAAINQAQVVPAGNLGGGGGGVFEPVASEASTPAAKVLDTLNGSVGGDMGTVLTAMAALPSAQRTAAVKKVSPESGMAIAQASNQTVTGALDTVQVRLDSLRSGEIPTPDLAYHNGSVHEDGHSNDGHQGGHHTGLSSGDQPMNRKYWIKGFGGKASQDNKGSFAGFDSDIYGLAFGADTMINDSWILGGAFTYARTNVKMGDFRNGDGADIDTYQLTAYAAKDFGRWYLEGMLSYAIQEYDTNRNTGVSGVAEGSFSGDQYALRVISGLPIETSYHNITVTPYIGFEANHISQDAFTEKGAGGFSLKIKDQDADRVRLLAGSKFKMKMELANGMVIHPSIQLRWRHELKTDGLDSTAAFVGGGGNFVTEGQAINRNVYTLGGGLEIERSDTASIAINFDTEAASGYRGYYGQIIGTWKF